MRPGRQHRQERAERQRKTPDQRISIRTTVAEAARAGWQYWRRILAVAVITSIITSLAEVLVEEFAARADLVTFFASLSAAGLSVLGAVFLSGFLCRLVAKPGDTGKPDDAAKALTIRKVLRILPW